MNKSRKSKSNKVTFTQPIISGVRRERVKGAWVWKSVKKFKTFHDLNLSPEERAIIALRRNPGGLLKDIAAEAGVCRTSLSRMKKFQIARGALRTKPAYPKGYKKDGVTEIIPELRKHVKKD